MALVDLTGLTPSPGNVGDANQIANALNALRAGVNGIDNSNVVAGAAILATKLNHVSDPLYALLGSGTWGRRGATLLHEDIANDQTTVQTSEGAATTITQATSIPVLAGERVELQLTAPQLYNSGANIIIIVAFRGATILGEVVRWDETVATDRIPLNVKTYDVPGAGTYNYGFKMWTSAGTATLKTGAGGSGTPRPATFRVSVVGP